jgi:hypothetical protein
MFVAIRRSAVWDIKSAKFVETSETVGISICENDWSKIVVIGEGGYVLVNVFPE